MLHDLCRRYRPAVVWLVGERTLGYPPTWIAGGAELLVLTNALNRFGG